MQAQEAIESQTQVERNMDLVRELLLKVAGDQEMDFTRQFPIGHPSLDIPGYSFDQLAYHARLLLENGYAKGDYRGPSISGLTWDGHEFLDSKRRRNLGNNKNATSGPSECHTESICGNSGSDRGGHRQETFRSAIRTAGLWNASTDARDA